ncbi:3-hydroxyacyl-CoA dehydrogenase family protein [Krasilnikovia sp. M28-CT-15]|uniref:3-hydroxyacyl-CoA dehydrogenase family protein n=1 Tax=Krasilnikovia sp. M28-CT-15 TaxID=3373540 RepID=UPI003876457F
MGDPAATARRRIGVLGAGAIGTTVGADFLLHDFDVVFVDRDEQTLAAAARKVAEAVRFAPLLRPGLGRLSRADLAERVRYGVDLEDLAACEFVVENVTEDWSIKRDLYRRLDAVLPSHVGIGVNTSSISIQRLAAETTRPESVIGIHFMNPSYATEAVEVMRGENTSDACLAYVEDLVQSLGKQAIVVGDFPGFVSNRISHVFFNEAARLVQEEGVDPGTVDQVFKRCFGHTMGPLETADLIGLDTVVLTLRQLQESTQETRYEPCQLLQQKVAEGAVGRKAGHGFYRY